MIATLPINRIGAHFDSPPITRRLLPEGERARGQLWSDVVFEAVLALRNQLTSRNDTLAAAAANSILELERTRMGRRAVGAPPPLDTFRIASVHYHCIV